eukprot:TRINITY_DN9304_c0_g1_i1.p1 TRINITY_DN9304_c0_g1~~TRINITY_DN9304_c0_g1_i1.p1  ORF type:complete len:374 (+),score=60.35 TRINITY_DN9304_c0_g1_i1:62-1123(+)
MTGYSPPTASVNQMTLSDQPMLPAPRPGFGSVPVEFRQHAANVSQWFPEVLMTLGAPDFEANYQPPQFSVRDSTCHRSMMVELQRHAFAAAAAQSQQVGKVLHRRRHVLDSLDRLAADIENLTLQLACLNTQNASTRTGGCIDPQGGLEVAAASLPNAPCESAPSSPPARPESGGAAMPKAEPTLPGGCKVLRLHSTRSDSLLSTPNYREDQLVGCTDDETRVQTTTHATKEPRTPRRGSQVQQGNLQPGSGRSRVTPNQGKVTNWLSEKQLPNLTVTKVKKLPQNEPQSPKLVKRSQVWGITRSTSLRTKTDMDLSADAIQDRIEKKLTKMFGNPKKYQSSPGLSPTYSTTG